jgi:hypothetical protein
MGGEAGGNSKVIDLFGELVHVILITTGCYAGWKLGENFPAMVAGGVVARVAWFFCWGAFHMVVGQTATD